MGIKAILFDLDGTLLPMDQQIFTKDYFGRLARWLVPRGYEPDKLIDAIWRGSAAMVKNDGAVTNEVRFWDEFASIFGERVRDDEPFFERFYHEQFDKVQASCGFDADARYAVKELKRLGYRLALATNPLFPPIATEKRAKWAGLDIVDFELVTTYDNSHFSKPNLDYYREILGKMRLRPEECLMVGNDVEEDMVAEDLGMKVYLVPACLLNKQNKGISGYAQGTLKDLPAYIETL